MSGGSTALGLRWGRIVPVGLWQWSLHISWQPGSRERDRQEGARTGYNLQRNPSDVLSSTRPHLLIAHSAWTHQWVNPLPKSMPSWLHAPLSNWVHQLGSKPSILRLFNVELGTPLKSCRSLQLQDLGVTSLSVSFGDQVTAVTNITTSSGGIVWSKILFADMQLSACPARSRSRTQPLGPPKINKFKAD
jgi:hypothetical protein